MTIDQTLKWLPGNHPAFPPCSVQHLPMAEAAIWPVWIKLRPDHWANIVPYNIIYLSLIGSGLAWQVVSFRHGAPLKKRIKQKTHTKNMYIWNIIFLWYLIFFIYWFEIQNFSQIVTFRSLFFLLSFGFVFFKFWTAWR